MNLQFITYLIIDACPTGFEQGFNDQCYRFGAVFETFTDARLECQKVENGDLVIVETEAENEYLKERTQGGDWWIGKWVWSSAVWPSGKSVLLGPSDPFIYTLSLLENNRDVSMYSRERCYNRVRHM